MGADYYLICPDDGVVTYIDRAGGQFDWALDKTRVVHPDWPVPLRQITAETLLQVDSEDYSGRPFWREVFEWVSARVLVGKAVFLVDDYSEEDEQTCDLINRETGYIDMLDPSDWVPPWLNNG